jgi:hypothetical protein
LSIGFASYSLVSVPPRSRYADPRRGRFDDRHEAVALENVLLADIIAKLRLPMQPKASRLKASVSLPRRRNRIARGSPTEN